MIPPMFVLIVIYFVHNWSQAREKEVGCRKLTASIKFSHFNMNESTTNTRCNVVVVDAVFLMVLDKAR